MIWRRTGYGIQVKENSHKLDRVLIIDPGRIGDWVMTYGMVKHFAAEFRVKPVWIAREELRCLICEQMDNDSWGCAIPSKFRLIDVPLFAARIARLRLTRWQGVYIMSPGKSARLALGILAGNPVKGYVRFNNENECVGADGTTRLYDECTHHLLQRAALVLTPEKMMNLATIPQSKIEVMRESRERVVDLLSSSKVASGTFILFAMGARLRFRRWPVEKWKKLAEKLAACNLQVVLCGGLGEQRDLEQLSVVDERLIKILPPLQLIDYIELVRSAGCLVTHDSGPMHIAAAVETPCVAIYGPSNQELTAPVRTDMSFRVVKSNACQYAPCMLPRTADIGGVCRQREHVCMSELDVESVFKEIHDLLAVVTSVDC